MNSRIDRDKLASLRYELSWESEKARHTDVYYARRVNFWRDIFHGDMKEKLMGLREGEGFRVPCNGALGGRDPDRVLDLRRYKFGYREIEGRPVEPRFGRFYPRGFLKGLPDVFPQDMNPFRLAALTEDDIRADLNHPLAGRTPRIAVSVENVRPKPPEIGGASAAWPETALDGGPGMQARCCGAAADFFSGDPFGRADETDDAVFYRAPRLTAHLDSRARENLRRLYGRLVEPGSRVLDLMSSLHSHLPDELETASVVGLGLNREELEKNARLTERVVHDLNREPKLPFDDGAFDSALCTVSVEYLTRPFEVFAEVARVLRPGGIFVVSFSNRWFPPKAIRLWTELHDFERLGLAVEYFLESGLFAEIETYSERGWPRPVDETDRFAGRVPLADPVFAVWGRTVGRG